MLYIDDIKLSDCGVIVGKIENELKDIDIYPNPFNDKLYIDLNNVIAGHQILIYDNLGRLVINLENKKEEIVVINSDKLSNGVYIIDIRNNKSSLRKKIILNKN
jgi:hypothetical protein